MDGSVPGEGWTSVRLLDRDGAQALRRVEVQRPRAAALLHRPSVAH